MRHPTLRFPGPLVHVPTTRAPPLGASQRCSCIGPVKRISVPPYGLPLGDHFIKTCGRRPTLSVVMESLAFREEH